MEPVGTANVPANQRFHFRGRLRAVRAVGKHDINIFTRYPICANRCKIGLSMILVGVARVTSLTITATALCGARIVSSRFIPKRILQRGGSHFFLNFRTV
jgi:hypothetical protein